VPAPSYVFTIARVAKMQGEDQEQLEEIALDMDPEVGRLSIMDLDDEVSVRAFAAFGVENLKELLADYKLNKRSK